MTKLNWEKTNRQENLRFGKEERKRKILSDFAIKHNLQCFVCGTNENSWAKTGISRKGPWGICVACISCGPNKRKAARPGSLRVA